MNIVSVINMGGAVPAVSFHQFGGLDLNILKPPGGDDEVCDGCFLFVTRRHPHSSDFTAKCQTGAGVL